MKKPVVALLAIAVVAGSMAIGATFPGLFNQPTTCRSDMTAALLPPILAAGEIGSGDAVNHVGEQVTMVGRVSRVVFYRGIVFLDFDAPYPHQSMAGVALHAARDTADVDYRSLEGRNVTLKGTVTLYKGKPQILLTSSDQISS